ncbi:hypothetical protein CVIRNUC_000581 [Coccomyxa viridis]|uniref:RING-type domain-containing protein n=1 Tax=Coccomyxa viridis TaxID=1274662 RepID=A0AAV1HRJ1_9CHLO|nr:hypothetical protein CVIRNUC_000581 [Coccomyxa viridis]
MSGADQGQSRLRARIQDNASTLESTAFTLSNYLQGLAHSLLPGRDTGRRSQSDGLRLSVQLGPSQRSVNEARRRSSSRSPRQEAPVSTEQASSAEAPADAAEDAAESGSSSSNDTAAAEGDVSTTGIDIQAYSAWLEKAAPFAILLLLIFLKNHILGIAVFTYLTAAIYKCNEVIKKEVALKGESSRFMVTVLGTIAAVQALSFLIVLYRQELWLNFIIAPREGSVKGFWDCLFKASVVDCLIRLIGFTGKSIVLLTHASQPEECFRRRAQVMSFMEQLLLIYRTIATIPVWLLFYEGIGMGSLLTSLMRGLYLWFKGRNLYLEILASYAFAKALVRREFVYGQVVSPADPQLMEGGSTCPICQDQMRTPIKLTCSHFFCDHCISTWLARERTCPMCRKIVRPAGIMPVSDGATPLVPVLF